MARNDGPAACRLGILPLAPPPPLFISSDPPPTSSPTGYGRVLCAAEEGEVVTAPVNSQRKQSIHMSSTAKAMANKLWKKPPALKEPEFRFGTFKFSIKAYPRSSDRLNCYMCGLEDHLEHFCPYNCIFGGLTDFCRGECYPR
ncbi:hypothetical protein PAHAL_2G330900 [Panicum hallii]|uniref:Uncharacterized protein n=1 Tax=Panicum hallii TaxID=206008 RepID=A0A2S3H172_9POAL|nr:hypothetical protein PAHAL_2G330900 [Panicum hallii]